MQSDVFNVFSAWTIRVDIRIMCRRFSNWGIMNKAFTKPRGGQLKVFLLVDTFRWSRQGWNFAWRLLTTKGFQKCLPGNRSWQVRITCPRQWQVYAIAARPTFAWHFYTAKRSEKLKIVVCWPEVFAKVMPGKEESRFSSFSVCCVYVTRYSENGGDTLLIFTWISQTRIN